MPPKAEKKTCMVPACEASSTDYPDRIFVSVPENKKREWLAMVGAESVYIHPTKRFFCCEEHFDVSAIPDKCSKPNVNYVEVVNHFAG